MTPAILGNVLPDAMRPQTSDEMTASARTPALGPFLLGAALRIEALGGQSKKMADGARPIHDFQPPFRTVAKPCDGVADHVRACHCGLVPGRAIIRQIDGHVA